MGRNYAQNSVWSSPWPCWLNLSLVHWRKVLWLRHFCQTIGSQLQKILFLDSVFKGQSTEKSHCLLFQGIKMRTTHLVTIQLGNSKHLEQLYSISTGWNPCFTLKGSSPGGAVCDLGWNTHLFLGWPNPKVESQLQFSWVMEFQLHYSLTTWVASTLFFFLRMK